MVAATDALRSPEDAGESIRANMRVQAYIVTSRSAPARARTRFIFSISTVPFWFQLLSNVERTVYMTVPTEQYTENKGLRQTEIGI